MPMYRTGFAHPLPLVHQCSYFLPKLCILFVRSESVLFGHTQIDKSMPRAQFVCPCSLFSVDRLAAIVRPFVACNISKGSSHPSAIIDGSNNLVPVLPFGQFAPFSVAPTSGRTAI